MQEVKKIGMLATAKILGLFGIVLGLVSILFSKIACSTNPEISALYGLNCTALTWPAAILGIVFAGVAYFAGGFVVAALYNLFAGWVGGIKIDFGKK